jgi:adenylate kinase family enzyme
MSRLQIITGKGGVGKTTFAIQKTMQLSREDKEVFYISLDELLDEKIINETGIQQKYFETTSSMQTYIARKLGSKMIAKWVAEAPFFKALFNILPSLGMMITLGHIIDELEKNPNYIFILDAPATGHTLSLFESTMNYRRIFGRGVLVDDIDKINDFLFDEHLVSFDIISVPTELALEESIELKESLQKLGFMDIKVILNDCLFLTKAISEHDEILPKFLKDKVDLQKELFESFKSHIGTKVSHVTDADNLSVIQSVDKEMMAP